jgi:hypothetical protein
VTHPLLVLRRKHVGVQKMPENKLSFVATGPHKLLMRLFESQEETSFITKYPSDFLEQLEAMSSNHEILMSFRIQKTGREANRRGSIEGWMKDTGTATKTNAEDVMCSGRIPKDFTFSTAEEYQKLDNNYPGAFHDDAADAPIEIVNTIKQGEPDAKDLQVKLLGNLICYSESVTKYEVDSKEKDQNNRIKAVGLTTKHFIQESERLGSIISRLERGIYKFVRGNSKEIIFTDNNDHVCKLDLSNLLNDEGVALPGRKDQPINNIAALKGYSEINRLNEIHAPVFYEKTSPDTKKHWMPVMVHAGYDGLAITGDADAHHIGMRIDMPAIVQKAYQGKVPTNGRLFLQGLEILIMRLKCPTREEFELTLSQNLGTNYKKILEEEYNDVYALDPNTEYKDYMQDEYYRDKFLAMTEATLERYQKDISSFKFAGQSSLYSLIIQNEFKHKAYTHGPESEHPGSTPEPFSGILVQYNGKTLATGDEFSYLCFLFSDPSILKQIIGVHPFWLRDRPREDSRPDLSEFWINALVVQGLNKASSDVQNGFDIYVQTLLRNMQRGRSSEQVAIAKIKKVMAEIKAELGNVANKQEYISQKISSIYQKYDEYTRFVPDVLGLKASASAEGASAEGASAEGAKKLAQRS